MATYFYIITQRDIVLLSKKIKSELILRSWSGLRGITVSRQKERLNKQMWSFSTSWIVGIWTELLMLSSCHHCKIREFDFSKVLRDPNSLSFDYSLLSSSLSGISSRPLTSIDWDVLVFAWCIAISSSTSILLFCRFWTFAARALIYGGKKWSYFDHKFQQYFLLVVGLVLMNMPEKYCHKINKNSRILARLSCWNMVSK